MNYSMRQPVFAYVKTLAQTSTVVFVTYVVLYFQNLKFQASKPSSVAIQSGLCQNWYEILKTGNRLFHARIICCMCIS